MNTLLRWDPISRTQWYPFKDRGELESRLATVIILIARSLFRLGALTCLSSLAKPPATSSHCPPYSPEVPHVNALGSRALSKGKRPDARRFTFLASGRRTQATD